LEQESLVLEVPRQPKVVKKNLVPKVANGPSGASGQHAVLSVLVVETKPELAVCLPRRNARMLAPIFELVTCVDRLTQKPKKKEAVAEVVALPVLW